MDRLLWRLLDRQIDVADRRSMRRNLGQEKKRRVFQPPYRPDVHLGGLA